MDIQKMMDTLSAVSRRERSGYHLTLGGLITALEKAPRDLPVVYEGGGSPGAPSSYRGYYSDLSFEPSNDPVTVDALLQKAKLAMGATFEGYKGGDFVMDERTPLWASSWGDCGPAIVGHVLTDSKLILTTKEID